MNKTFPIVAFSYLEYFYDWERYADALITIDKNKEKTFILNYSEFVMLASSYLSDCPSWGNTHTEVPPHQPPQRKSLRSEDDSRGLSLLRSFEPCDYRWRGYLATGKNKTTEDVNFFNPVLAKNSFLTILLIRTKSSGFLAQGGRSTSFTTTSSSLTPRWYPLLLTNISGR